MAEIPDYDAMEWYRERKAAREAVEVRAQESFAELLRGAEDATLIELRIYLAGQVEAHHARPWSLDLIDQESARRVKDRGYEIAL